MNKISLLSILFIFLYVLNHIAFISYNYSWFSLLCTVNIIDLYTTFNIFNSSVFFCKFYDYLLHYPWNNASTLSCIFFDRWSICDVHIYYNSIVSTFFNNLLSLPSVDIQLDSVYCIYFDTKVIGNSNIYFYILQNKLFVVPGETSLCFFRLCNQNNYSIQAVTVYTISPFELVPFVNKIQCFCFEQINMHPFDVIELPVLFLLNSNVVFLNFLSLREICIEYVLLCTKVL